MRGNGGSCVQDAARRKWLHSHTPTRKWFHTLPVQYETMKALNESVRGIVASWERKRETYDTCIVVYEARCARFRPCTHPAPPVS